MIPNGTLRKSSLLHMLSCFWHFSCIHSAIDCASWGTRMIECDGKQGWCCLHHTCAGKGVLALRVGGELRVQHGAHQGNGVEQTL
jgi:hypothetical protein